MRSRRKILFISSNFPPVIGGSAVVYDQLCKNAGGKIVALGASHDYRTGEAWSDLAQTDATRGYRIHRLAFLRPPEFAADPTHWVGRATRVIFRDLPIMIRTLAYVLVLLARYRVKVICLGELIYGGWLVFPLRYVLGRTVLIYTHGEEISQDTENLLARRRGLFLRHANRVIAVSQFCKGQIISKYHIPPDKICVVNNGVDLSVFNRDEHHRDIWPEAIRGRRIILSISRLVERKGQETLIRAMPQILSAHPDAHCVIVGGGPLENKLREVASELGVTAACTVVGPAPQKDVIEYFRNCELFALPCHTLPDGDTEGFGLVFLEAGACCKPVVAGVAGGTIEAVADGETGLLVDGTSVTQVADAITSLLSDPQYAMRLAEAGWRRAQDSSWESVAQIFLEVCDMRGAAPATPSYRSIIPMLKTSYRNSTNRIVPNLLVTVDVEEEFGWEEFDRKKHVVKGVEALEQFHVDCRSIGVSPVYLLTYPILKDEKYRCFLKGVAARHEAEVGIHLHSWTAPPFWEEPNVYSSYQCNLPEHVERRKIQVLCRTFEECFDRPVAIHRAGRWGGGERTSDILEQFGISLDLSPSTGYSDVGSGGPNFANLDGSPFWSGTSGQVLTVPASSVNYLRGPRWLSSMAFGLMRNLHIFRSRLWQRGKAVRFSPENADEATLYAIAGELGSRGLPTAVYTLHSTSLYLDGNQYSEGSGKALALRQRSLNFLRRAIDTKLVQPTTCAQLLDLARSERLNS